MRPHPKEVRATAQAMFIAGLPVHSIAKRMGIPPTTIKHWSKQDAWFPARQALEAHSIQAVDNTISREIERRSASVQDLLSSDIESKAKALHTCKVRGIRGLGEHIPLLAQLIGAADKLFGWSRSDTPGCLIQNNYLGELRPPATPQAEPEQAVPVVSCDQ